MQIFHDLDLYSIFRLYQQGSRRPVVFSPSTEMGLTDIEMAQFEYEEGYFDDRQYDFEYEVRTSWH